MAKNYIRTALWVCLALSLLLISSTVPPLQPKAAQAWDWWKLGKSVIQPGTVLQYKDEYYIQEYDYEVIEGEYDEEGMPLVKCWTEGWKLVKSVSFTVTVTEAFIPTGEELRVVEELVKIGEWDRRYAETRVYYQYKVTQEQIHDEDISYEGIAPYGRGTEKYRRHPGIGNLFYWKKTLPTDSRWTGSGGSFELKRTDRDSGASAVISKASYDGRGILVNGESIGRYTFFLCNTRRGSFVPLKKVVRTRTGITLPGNFPPAITITDPEEGEVFYYLPGEETWEVGITVEGSVFDGDDDVAEVIVYNGGDLGSCVGTTDIRYWDAYVSGEYASGFDESGAFRHFIELSPGDNLICVVAHDEAGRENKYSVRVTLEEGIQPPTELIRQPPPKATQSIQPGLVLKYKVEKYERHRLFPESYRENRVGEPEVIQTGYITVEVTKVYTSGSEGVPPYVDYSLQAEGISLGYTPTGRSYKTEERDQRWLPDFWKFLMLEEMPPVGKTWDLGGGRESRYVGGGVFEITRAWEKPEMRWAYRTCYYNDAGILVKAVNVDKVARARDRLWVPRSWEERTLVTEKEAPVTLEAFFTYFIHAFSEVRFNATKSTGNITKYQWDFGDGGTDEGVKLTHIFKDPGVYQVALTVSDAKGHTDTSTQLIEIVEEPELKVSVSPVSIVITDKGQQLKIDVTVRDSEGNPLDDAHVDYRIEDPDLVIYGWGVSPESPSKSTQNGAVSFTHSIPAYDGLRSKDMDNFPTTLTIRVEAQKGDWERTEEAAVTVDVLSITGDVVGITGKPLGDIYISVKLADDKPEGYLTKATGRFKAAAPKEERLYIVVADAPWLRYLPVKHITRPGAHLHIVMATEEQYEEAIKKDIADFLRQVGIRNPEGILDEVEFKYGKSIKWKRSTFGKDTIYLPKKTYWVGTKNGSDKEIANVLTDFYHEFAHHIMDKVAHDDIKEAQHSMWKVSNWNTAFDEARAHFFAELMLSYRGIAKENPYTPEEFKKHVVGRVGRGSTIEGVVATLWMGYYGEEVKTNPYAVLKRYMEAIKKSQEILYGRLPRTILEWMQAEMILHPERSGEMHKLARELNIKILP